MEESENRRSRMSQALSHSMQNSQSSAIIPTSAQGVGVAPTSFPLNSLNPTVSFQMNSSQQILRELKDAVVLNNCTGVTININLK